MNTLNKILFFICFTLVVSHNFAQTENKDVTITSSGSGKTLENAKQAALRSATEQAFGAFISSKTEMFNDHVVADQMSSVSSGNIKSYEVLNESQLPDGSWGVTLKTIVSLDKLTSFVEAKGIAIEIKGGMFALNIKQQLLNEQGEIKAVSEMVGLLHEPMQISFDYVIKSSDPKSVDAESKNWEIPLVVTATTNKNIDFCANYCIKTLAALSLSSEEVASYQSLNKAVFPVVINYNGVAKTFYLRKQSSINALNTLTNNWEFYTRLFTVQSGMDESNGNGEGRIHDFSSSRNYNNEGKSINFLTTGQQAATFSWQDKRTLSQIEQMTGYKVKPRGVVSPFKHGGFVVFEENGHGLVAAITDLGNMDWNSAKTACEELILNGYSDWHLPSKEELNSVYVNLKQVGGGGFADNDYWSSTEDHYSNVWEQNFGNGSQHRYWNGRTNVRAVRTFYNEVFLKDQKEAKRKAEEAAEVKRKAQEEEEVKRKAEAAAEAKLKSEEEEAKRKAKEEEIRIMRQTDAKKEYQEALTLIASNKYDVAIQALMRAKSTYPQEEYNKALINTCELYFQQILLDSLTLVSTSDKKEKEKFNKEFGEQLKTINEYFKKEKIKIELLRLDLLLINTLNTMTVECPNLPFQVVENGSMVCIYFSNEADGEKIKQVLRHNKDSPVYERELHGKKCYVLYYINE